MQTGLNKMIDTLYDSENHELLFFHILKIPRPASWFFKVDEALCLLAII